MWKQTKNTKINIMYLTLPMCHYFITRKEEMVESSIQIKLLVTEELLLFFFCGIPGGVV